MASRVEMMSNGRFLELDSRRKETPEIAAASPYMPDLVPGNARTLPDAPFSPLLESGCFGSSELLGPSSQKIIELHALRLFFLCNFRFAIVATMRLHCWGRWVQKALS